MRDSREAGLDVRLQMKFPQTACIQARLRSSLAAALRAAILAALTAACGLPAWSQTRIVVPFAAGGNADLTARMLARHMTQGVPQPVVVENRPGASGLIGARHVSRSAPDGRTLLFGTTALALATLAHRDFDPRTELAPVIEVATSDSLLVVHAGLPIHTIADLRRVASEKPGGLNCAGVAGQMALACERLRLLLGNKLVTIPYNSMAPALNALLAGQVDLIVPPSAAVVSLLSGRPQARVIAAATAGRALPPFDHLPVLKDTWPDMVLKTVNAVYAAPGTPADVIGALNRELNRVLALPEVRAWMDEVGHQPIGGPPAVLARTLASDIDFYRRLADEIGINPDLVR